MALFCSAQVLHPLQQHALGLLPLARALERGAMPKLNYINAIGGMSEAGKAAVVKARSGVEVRLY